MEEKKPVLYYCYDAYCGWCFGNTIITKELIADYANKLEFEVLSGGMIISDSPKPISVMATYIQSAYKRVEEYTGIKFGEDFLWHIFNPEQSDWFPNSEMPAIALSIFKEIHPNRQMQFATNLQEALHIDGRDLCDKEAYRHLLEKYQLDADDFYAKLANPAYKEMAYNEFQICKQLQVSGFPSMYVQMPNNKFYQISNGYTPYQNLKTNIENVLQKSNQ
jgi:putative protein-disulfide isomerase